MMKSQDFDRREFLATATAAALALPGVAAPSAPKRKPTRWRGFNLPPFFGTWNNGIPVEDDFRMIADLGFNFVRLPMWYTLWTDPKDWHKVNEAYLANIDRAVEFGGKYGLHINLNLHRGPGYCIAKDPPEPFNLFKDPEALDAFCFQWDLFAQRYKALSNERISFNLINEPSASIADYGRVVRATLKTIHATSPERTVVIDGNLVARAPMPDLADTGVIQSVHSYDPMPISHYKASWADADNKFPEPTWPIARDGKVAYDKTNLEKLFSQWIDLAKSGVQVHCGECGCYSKTPHDVFLRWFTDVLDILTEHNIGYALWEFRGDFGILDSNRADVAYEDFHGHKLDRKLLDLLQKH